MKKVVFCLGLCLVFVLGACEAVTQGDNTGGGIEQFPLRYDVVEAPSVGALPIIMSSSTDGTHNY